MVSALIEWLRQGTCSNDLGKELARAHCKLSLPRRRRLRWRCQLNGKVAHYLEPNGNVWWDFVTGNLAWHHSKGDESECATVVGGSLTFKCGFWISLLIVYMWYGLANVRFYPKRPRSWLSSARNRNIFNCCYQKEPFEFGSRDNTRFLLSKANPFCIVFLVGILFVFSYLDARFAAKQFAVYIVASLCGSWAW